MDCTRLAAPAGTLRTAAVDELKAHFFGSPAALPDTLQLEMIARGKEEACGKKPLIRRGFPLTVTAFLLVNTCELRGTFCMCPLEIILPSPSRLRVSVWCQVFRG